jgi:hypothetical protein
VGNVVQPLQSVNCHYSCAHILVGFVCGMQQVRSLCAWFLLWLQVGCLWAMLVLPAGGMPVSVGQFSYMYDSYELVAIGYSWVTEVQCHA